MLIAYDLTSSFPVTYTLPARVRTLADKLPWRVPSAPPIASRPARWRSGYPPGLESDMDKPVAETRTLGGRTFVVAAGCDYAAWGIDCPIEAATMYNDGLVTEDERDYLIALLDQPQSRQR